MGAKSSIAGCILLLALTVSGAKHSVSASAASSATAVHGTIPQLKTIPGDTASWRREPFKSPAITDHITAPSVKHSPAGTSPDLDLQGIMMSNHHNYAIINGRSVKRGDHINEWTVTDISRRRVTLRREKEKRIYDIYQGRIDRGTR
jgi:hypothetical protein